MPICTFSKFKTIGVPEGSEILEWLDRVNKITGDKFRIEGYKIYYGFFGTKSKMVYNLIYDYLNSKTGIGYGDVQVQVINLNSRLGECTLDEIGAYLLGYVSGYEENNND